MKNFIYSKGFTLTEMLMALLIVSVILSASLPVITLRAKGNMAVRNADSSFPIGGIIAWADLNKLPDNTWLEANGQAIPNGIEYEQIRRVYGSNLPDMRGMQKEIYDTFSDYIRTDLKDYLDKNLVTFPKDAVAIWGVSGAVPSGWAEAEEYRGVFLRGYGSVNSSHFGNVTHSSGAIGVLQGDSIREMNGALHTGWGNILGSGIFYEDSSVRGMKANNPVFTDPNKATVYFQASRVTPASNEIRPVNKAVKFIRFDGSGLTNFPQTPQIKTNYRYIVKVRY